MKRFQFLLLDAGPIIKLFELGIWDKFIEKCNVTVSRTVADEARYASQEFEDVCIDLEPYEQQGLIRFIDLDSSAVKVFQDKFSSRYKVDIHAGEKETLAYLCQSSEAWLLCTADKAGYRVLGLLGRAEQGVSLEEVLRKIGLLRNLKWEYTKKFREKYTRVGRIDSIQDQGLV